MEIYGIPEDYHISVFTDNAESFELAYKNGVEVIHIPTGIGARCSTERNMHTNRERCMAEISAKIKQYEAKSISVAEIDDALNLILIASGSALRHYTMPGTLEKMRKATLEIIKRAYLDALIETPSRT